ncbi:MAG: hypothetical protein RRY55_01330 [Bacteroidales bacterium]
MDAKTAAVLRDSVMMSGNEASMLTHDKGVTDRSVTDGNVEECVERVFYSAPDSAGRQYVLQTDKTIRREEVTVIYNITGYDSLHRVDNVKWHGTSVSVDSVRSVRAESGESSTRTFTSMWVVFGLCALALVGLAMLFVIKRYVIL